MRVGIDICRLTDPWTGVGNYIVNLLSGLAQADKHNQYFLYPYFWECFPRDIKALARFTPQQENFFFFGDMRSEFQAKLLWAKLRLHSERLLAAVDVTHSTNLAAPRLKKSNLVVTVHDLSFVRHPDWHKEDNVAFSRHNLEQALNRAELLIAPSEFTARELEDLYPQCRGRVRVVPEAVLPQFRPWQENESQAAASGLAKKYGLNHPYFLFVGTLEPRKNLPSLLKAFGILREQSPVTHDLVLAGGRGWRCEPILAALDEASRLNPQDENQPGRVRWLGYVPGEDLPDLYRHAFALIYPSLYEGFGLPVLEGMSCGIPVITAPFASLPEVGGDAVLYADPSSPEELAEVVGRLLADPDLWKRLASAGLKHSQGFSQKNMGYNTLKVYQELAG
jgi:glycosyltransferase involved in cell wall biosynthesis